jgi:hypothetical protein
MGSRTKTKDELRIAESEHDWRERKRGGDLPKKLKG